MTTVTRPSSDEAEVVEPPRLSDVRKYPDKITRRVTSGELANRGGGGPTPLLPPPDDEIVMTAESWVNPNPTNPSSLYHGSRSVTDQPIYYIAVWHWFFMDGEVIEYGHRAYHNNYLAGIWAETPDDTNTNEPWESVGYHEFQPYEDDVIFYRWTHASLYH